MFKKFIKRIIPSFQNDSEDLKVTPEELKFRLQLSINEDLELQLQEFSEETSRETSVEADGVQRLENASEGDTPQTQTPQQDMSERIAALISLAEEENAQAQYHLGLLYGESDHVLRDIELAFKWLQRAAENGYEPAQIRLAVWYMLGKGKRKDPQAVYRWLLPLAEAGNVLGQRHLGFYYFACASDAPQLKETQYWWEKAAENGDGFSAFKLQLLRLSIVTIPLMI